MLAVKKNRHFLNISANMSCMWCESIQCGNTFLLQMKVLICLVIMLIIHAKLNVKHRVSGIVAYCHITAAMYPRTLCYVPLHTCCVIRYVLVSQGFFQDYSKDIPSHRQNRENE